MTRPSRPGALASAVVAFVILLISLTSGGGFSLLLAVWTLLLAGIIAFNLWVAFAPPEAGRRSGRRARAHRPELTYRHGGRLT